MATRPRDRDQVGGQSPEIETSVAVDSRRVISSEEAVLTRWWVPAQAAGTPASIELPLLEVAPAGISGDRLRARETGLPAPEDVSEDPLSFLPADSGSHDHLVVPFPAPGSLSSLR